MTTDLQNKKAAEGEMRQQPLPLAFIRGEAVVQKPEDLYIPPDALEVILEAFEGPLDLLLYLIKKRKFDILDLPIAAITEQYMEYVEMMKTVKLELASEYLVMAAMLAEIKSRLLLPKQQVEEEEDDPRAELVKRLQEYEIFKIAAADLDEIPRVERDIHIANAKLNKSHDSGQMYAQVDLQELVLALQSVMKRAKAFEDHHIEREKLSTRERMSLIIDTLSSAGDTFVRFESLFEVKEGRAGVVVTFLAILELLKDGIITVVQAEQFGPIRVRLA